MRKLKDVDMWLQENKVTNLKIAAKCLNGIHVGEEYLEGEWRVAAEPEYRYEVEERNHEIRSEYWGGYSRHNEIYQKQYDLEGNLLGEKLVVKNSAIMMYSPFLEDKA
ncbi:MAG: hypothetical protein IJZ34_13800 [Lachnospiraceae bacterium]|nr:hypothetical protein [Lachnospiraceae bacterium]